MLSYPSSRPLAAGRSAKAPELPTYLIICIALVLLGGSAMSHSETHAEARILTAILNDSQLSRYYHRDLHPERFPLQIVDTGGAALTLPDPAATSVPVVLIGPGETPDSHHATLIIDSLELRGSQASVTFRFPAEGLSGEASLETGEKGSWTVTEMRLREH